MPGKSWRNGLRPPPADSFSQPSPPQRPARKSGPLVYRAVRLRQSFTPKDAKAAAENDGSHGPHPLDHCSHSAERATMSVMIRHGDVEVVAKKLAGLHRNLS